MFPPRTPRPLPWYFFSRAFTLLELLASVSVIAILAALLLPALSKVRESSNSAGCCSNLRTLGGAIQSFTADYGYFPPAVAELDASGNTIHNMWLEELAMSYLGFDWRHGAGAATWKKASVFNCPSETQKGSSFLYTYAENDDTRADLAPNGHLRPQSLAYPSSYALVSDSYGKYDLNASSKTYLETFGVTRRHYGHPNILYADGHVSSFTGTVSGYRDGQPQDFYLKMWRWNAQPNN